MIRVGLVQADHPITSPAFFHSAEEFSGSLRLSLRSADDYQEVSVLGVLCVLLYFVIQHVIIIKLELKKVNDEM